MTKNIFKSEKLFTGNYLPLLSIMFIFSCFFILKSPYTSTGAGFPNPNDSVKNYKLYAKKIYGANPNPTGEPIGGGWGYSKLINKYTVLVTNKKEFLTALKTAKKGDIIYISDTTQIDLTGMHDIKVPGGITLASGRGKNKNDPGALIYTNQMATVPLFFFLGEKVHITGLRMFGPDTARRTKEMAEFMNKRLACNCDTPKLKPPTARGIYSGYSYTEIDNCEFMGWSGCAIFLTGIDGKCDSNYVHNNYFHHNHRDAFGYGVSLNQSFALVEANLFDWSRHAIAGTGVAGTSYEARYNIIKEHSNGHNFDMHGGMDRRNDETNIAGDSIYIHHNTFMALNQNVYIRGIPQTRALIENNWFYQKDTTRPVAQTIMIDKKKITFKTTNKLNNFYVTNNKYGTGKKAIIK